MKLNKKRTNWKKSNKCEGIANNIKSITVNDSVKGRIILDTASIAICISALSLVVSLSQFVISYRQSSVSISVSRPFLQLSDYRWWQADAGTNGYRPTVFQFFMKNTGQTPALRVRQKINFMHYKVGSNSIVIFDGELPIQIAGSEIGTPQDGGFKDRTELPHESVRPPVTYSDPPQITISSQQSSTLGLIVIDAPLMSAAALGRIRVFIWGWAEYEDTVGTGTRHRTEFSVEVFVKGEPLHGKAEIQLRPFGSFNRTT